MRSLVLLGAASATAAALTLASRGELGYAAAAAWGLGGIGLRARREHNHVVLWAAALGVVTVTAATLLGRYRGGRT